MGRAADGRQEYSLPMPVSSFRRFATLATLAGLPVMASTPAPLPSVHRAQDQSTTLVTVGFRVLARDGSPVLDLKPEEVVLKVGGRAREIVAIELMRSVGAVAPGSAVAAPPLFVTNAPLVGGRVVRLLVDEEAIEPGHDEPVKRALGQLVAALAPEDQVGLRTLKGVGATVQPTPRHDRVLAAIARLQGRSTPLEATADALCRTRLANDALLNLFEGAVPSAVTVAVLVSNGLTSPTTATMSTIRGSGGLAGSVTPSACEFSGADLIALASAAADSRVHVYGLQVFRGVDIGAGMENFAGLTGNAMVRLSGDTTAPMKRIASETSAYYLAAFEVPQSERTGSPQRVAVSVAREGLEVKAWPSLIIPKADARPVKADKPKLRDLLATARVFRDLPLRATIHTSHASTDGKLRVVCVFDSNDPSAKIAEASAALFDDTGKPRTQWSGQPAAFKKSPVMATLTAPGPGTYRMRLAALDASGAAGTLDEEVRVEAASPGSAVTSALVLGTKDGPGFAPRLEFVNEPVAIAMVEIFGVTKATAVEATFEFALSEDSPARGSIPGTVESPRDDLRIAHVSFPVAQMSAGDVVVRAVITVDGKPLAAKPFHTLRKVVR